MRVWAGISVMFILFIGAGCTQNTAPDAGLPDARLPQPPPLDAEIMDAEADATPLPDAPDLTLTPPDPRSPPLPRNLRGFLEPPCAENPQCPGSHYLEWALQDFQPVSPRYNETYGLSAFGRRVIVMGLHAGWCGYCRSQVAQMERMSNQLRDEGHDVQFLSVNAISASTEPHQRGLLYQLDELGEIMTDEDGNPVRRTTFPIMQDTNLVHHWDMHWGHKDDFFIYDRDGILTHYFASRGPGTTNLSTEAGYDRLYGAVLEALAR